jgi:shikimate 5-dehydrogenase
MKMNINKDTKIYGSFSNNPGNNGCIFFNEAFQKYNINAIYKSFYSDDIESSIKSALHLGFGGFAISAPHKINVLNYLDERDSSVDEIGSCNTVLIKDNKLYGYNTDWVGVNRYLDYKINKLTILGDGGFSKAVQYVCKLRDIDYKIITRNNWDDIFKIKGYVFNATPIDVKTKGIMIEGRADFLSGKIISRYQAIEQFKIYTGIEYE